MGRNLRHLLELCHEFGTTEYVVGGGGNASYKDGNDLWVKASGTTLSQASEQTLVRVNRGKAAEALGASLPREPSAREAEIKRILKEAVVDATDSRPSVETLLHNLFDAAYVMHTHPPLVNGLTCAQQGEKHAARLFPDALWGAYTDPGYTLCAKIAKDIASYRKQHGCQPTVVLLQNHGVFVAGATPQEIRDTHGKMLSTLREEYGRCGLSTTLARRPAPSVTETMPFVKGVAEALGGAELVIGEQMLIAPGPLTPDHIVNSKAHYLIGTISPEAVREFYERHGYMPQILANELFTAGAAKSRAVAELALDMARDGSLVLQLTNAFGGVRYMTQREYDFIENWEAESYRRKTYAQQVEVGGVVPAKESGIKMAKSTIAAFELAQERYLEIGVDCENALKALDCFSISMHCWQGDDVAGFEDNAGLTDGGILATGNYPGRARNADELRKDIEKAFSLIPGRHRVNLHALYAETNGAKVDRDALEPSHFSNWVEWAKMHGAGLDFNPSFFSHARAADGFTLSSADPDTRQFWIDHGVACRKIGEHIGRSLGTPCVTNIWIPDGYKDTPVDRLGPRERLIESLDQIFAVPLPKANILDSVESKLFGIGSEAYVVGSHEFYMGYAMSRGVLACLDAGHFHPTETIDDKISSMMLYCDQLLLHVSRGVRWDSDHVITLDDNLLHIAQEIVRGGYADRVHIGLDYFDATINRVAAWVIGMRNMQKALLAALLEPADMLKEAESEGDFTRRLMLLEESKSMPLSPVWNMYCERKGVPTGITWLREIREYEKSTLFCR